MAPPVSDYVKGQILVLGRQKWSRSMIVRELKKSSITVSESTVSRVLRNHNNKEVNQPVIQQSAKKAPRPRVCTPEKVKKVKNYIASHNPPTQRDMARRVGVSQTSIHRLIHKRLDNRTRTKAKVDHLTEAAILQRKVKAQEFYNLVANEKFRFMFTMDEAMLPLDYQNGQRKIYYEPRNQKLRREKPPVATKSPSWPQQQMFAAGFCWRGQSRLCVVEKKAKVNVEYVIEHLLAPMMLKDVPRLFGADADKMVLHLDSASSHTAKPVRDWLDAHNIKYITKKKWLANSPDLSPMDFFANGYFKSQLARRKYKSVKGMLECAKEEWEKIPLEMMQNALRSWPDRINAVEKAQGHAVSKISKKNN